MVPLVETVKTVTGATVNRVELATIQFYLRRVKTMREKNIIVNGLGPNGKALLAEIERILDNPS